MLLELILNEWWWVFYQMEYSECCITAFELHLHTWNSSLKMKYTEKISLHYRHWVSIKTIPHFCGTNYICQFRQYSRLSGPPTLLKNKEAIWTWWTLNKSIIIIMFISIQSTYLRLILLIFFQASLFLCSIPFPLVTPRHRWKNSFVCTIWGKVYE